MKHRIFRPLAIVLLLYRARCAQDVASFEKRITAKTSPKRPDPPYLRAPEAPVFSFFTLVDAGSTQDLCARPVWPTCSSTWLFKGTDKIGTTDYAAEKRRSKKWRPPMAAYIREVTKK